MTVMGFVRHGITEWNIENRAQGQTDIPLNETGKAQARALAARLQNEEWDMIYSSDLSRARETAEMIAAATGLEIHLDERLREIHCGLIEGTTEEDRMRKWGEEWDTFELGIESDEALIRRGVSVVNDICDQHPHERILIVSHGAWIGKLLPVLIPHTDTREHLHNTSITRISKGEARWECELYNCAKHLEEAR
ncbi:histidine phosphatase family protein [Paenibacillus pini]|uniref:Phosphoglycerate mutase n=1 Tax=Paenibacillus pini JCM 16418 TaxID=1236976 RepID=W7Y9Z3_9BACL|nr:histidine phosphatase family protein [Paenibacillus pini]GAF07860.1 phosphoglycerate mutase [Paenibacillus pini JCM 16418]